MHEGRTAAAPGIVFGHENLGIVEEVDDAVTSIKPGDRVVMPFNVACGFWKHCIASYTAFCLTPAARHRRMCPQHTRSGSAAMGARRSGS